MKHWICSVPGQQWSGSERERSHDGGEEEHGEARREEGGTLGSVDVVAASLQSDEVREEAVEKIQGAD